jgi:hypothetical protein
VGSLPAAVHGLINVLERLAGSYRLSDVYRALHYVAVETALLLRGLGSVTPKPPEEGVLRLLLSLSRERLREPLRGVIAWMDRVLSGRAPLVVREGSVEELARLLSESVKRPVDRVVAHDGLSLLEVVASAAYLRSRKAFHAVLVDYVFVNPPGITRYVSEQATRGLRQSLTGVAQMIAQRLGARDYRRVSYVDSVVHEHGEAGWSVFLEHLDVERIAEELGELASRGCLLVFSDHGYDVVLDEEGGLYVTHGYKLEAGEGRVILPLSRFSFVLVVFPAS